MMVDCDDENATLVTNDTYARDHNTFPADEEESPDGACSPVKREGHLISAHRALMNFVRAEVAAGALTLPVAFKYAGLWVGLGLSPLIAIANTVFGLSIVHCSQRLCEKSGRPALDYGHFAKKAFDYGPAYLQPYSKKALYTCNVCVSLYQIGVAAVQAAFISVNLCKFIQWTGSEWVPSERQMLSMLLPLWLILNQIRRLDILGILATVGNVMYLIGFVIVMQHVVQPPNLINILPGSGAPIPFFLYLGAMLYAFEGQTMILPLENKMKQPQAMAGWTGVLTTGMVIIGSIYTAIGFFGFAKFGSDCKGSLTLNMPATALYQSVNLILATAVLLGWPLAPYVIVEMLFPPVMRKLVTKHVPLFPRWGAETLFRLAISILIYALAIAVPNLGLLVPLVGISVGVLIAFVFPPLLELVVFWSEWSERQRRWYCMRNVTMTALGVILFLGGTYANIYAIVVMSGALQELNS